MWHGFFGVLAVIAGIAWSEVVLAADDDDDCARVVRALDTGGADYKPEVDVYGRPVAPADAQPTLRIDPPKVIEFPIDIDLAKRMGFDAHGPYEAKGTVARVRIEGRRITVNGRDIVTDDAAALIAACRVSRR